MGPRGHGTTGPRVHGSKGPRDHRSTSTWVHENNGFEARKQMLGRRDIEDPYSQAVEEMCIHMIYI